MRPDEYTIVIGGNGVGNTSTPQKSAITAIRLKGDPIMETRQVQVGTTPGKVLLELTPYAAEVLRGLVGSVCGPDAGPGGQITQIYHALDGAGVYAARLSSKSGLGLDTIWIQ